ncbi:MAG: hypothetical protein AAB359_07990, partial [Elusimicrobiota bacterium]
LYNVDFADALSGLTTAQYLITSQPLGAGAVLKNWTDIYSSAAGTAAYSGDWPVDFAALQEWATGYVSARAYDLVGKLSVSTDVFHVWKDTTPPAASVAVFSVSSRTLTLSGSGSDLSSGVRDYHFEISPADDFSSDVSSNAYAVSNTAVFADMPEAVVYYGRLKIRDNVYNESQYTAVVSTMTRGFVHISSQSLSPAAAMQGTDAVMLSAGMSTNPGHSAALTSLVVGKGTSTASSSDIIAVKLYRDNNSDGAVDAGDTLHGSAGFSGINATVQITPAVPVSDTPIRILVVYSFNSAATVGRSAKAEITAPSGIRFNDPYIPVPADAFPIISGFAHITDGPGTLNITPASIAPSITPPGTGNIGIVKLAIRTNVGTGKIDALNVRLSGTIPSNNISGVKLYRDANGNAQFDVISDLLLTSGSDIFA